MKKVIFKDGKRVSARGIIIKDDSVYLMFRRKKKDDGTFKEYYVVPGGGIEDGESEIEALKREMSEELSVNVNVLGKIATDEGENSIANFYALNIVDGNPKLGGEELLRMNEDNYYEVRLIKISDLDNIDVTGKDYIVDAYNKKYR